MNDIELKVNGQIIVGSDILSAVDEVLKLIRETDDIDGAANALRSLKGLEKITGKGLAKLLNGLQQWWEETNQEEKTGDTFKDWVSSIDIEFNDTYIKRLVSIQKYEDDGTFSDRLMEHPIKMKQAIASHLDQGFELTNKELKELERATNEYEVGAILRKAKGKPPRKNTLSIELERDGSLNVWFQDEVFFGGYLASPEKAQTSKEREALEKMRSRLTKNTGVKIR